MPTNNACNNTEPNYLPLAGGTMTGTLTLNGNPSAANDAANKAYVDLIAAGFEFKNACYAGTTAALTATYVNGAAGVGATLTNAGALAAFSVDGQSPPINSRILVKNQGSTFQNGIYTLTTVGSGAVAWILLRATDYDQTSEIHAGDLVPVDFGATLANSIWNQTATVATIGTDPITFSIFTYGPSTFLQVANNLSDVASASTSFNTIAPATIKGGAVIGSGVNTYANLAVGTDYQFRMADSSATNGQSYQYALSWGGIPLRNPSFPSGFVGNAGSGNVDLYTVPAGKRALVMGGTLYNTAGTNTTYAFQVKISGTYYPLFASGVQTATTGANSSPAIDHIAYIYEAAEVISINTSQAGLNVWPVIITFDNTSGPKTVKLTTLASGDNTVYTVPANKTAIVLTPEMYPSDNNLAAFNYYNASGGTRTIIWYVVPSGGSKGSTNQIQASANVSTGAKNTFNSGKCSMNTGDFVVINTNAATATQMAWVSVMEF